MAKELNDRMEFGLVIRVRGDRSVVDADEVHAPELYDDESVKGPWRLLDGFSGQYGYTGPIMHPSEYVGGGLERHILDHPGFYVTLVHYPNSEDDDEPDGWAVAYWDGRPS